MKYRNKNVSFYFLFQKISFGESGTKLSKFAPTYLDENNIIFVTSATFRENKLANVSD